MKKYQFKFPHNRIHQIPSGLDLTPFLNLPEKNEARETLGLPREIAFLGLIGRFDKQKGQLTVLEAFKKLIEQTDKPVGLVFLGEKTNNEADDYYDMILHFIKDNHLKEKVFILPFRKDIETFYAAIDYFIMASLHETFGMVTIEAMASGKKIIGSNTGGTPEILQHRKLGKLFSPTNVAELSNVLKEALETNNFPTIEELTTAAKKYDFNTVCEQVEEILRFTEL
jgi:glycosyltransferase involved in cell wall biosynthesis